MSEHTDDLVTIEPERYEFFTGGPVSRRDFFKVVGSGLVVLWLMDGVPAPAQQRRGRGGRGGFGRFGQPTSQDIGAWLHVGADNTVTVYTGKVELGQNIRTSLAQAVAEELRTPIERVRLVMADTALVPFDMGTFGSMTTPRMASQLHRMAAAARDLLLDMAVKRTGVGRSELTVADGKVTGRGGQVDLTFGQLTGGKKLMKVVSGEVPTTLASEWKVAGKPVPRVNGHEIVTGGHKYSSDVKREGMLHGKVVRPPTVYPPNIRPKLVSADLSKAKAMPGVTVVREGDFIGVTAPTLHEAEKAVAAIKAEWQPPPQQPSDKEIYQYLKKHAGAGGGGGFGGRGSPPRGSVEKGLSEADHKLEATYTVAYIAHVPLETRAAVAEWQGDRLTVWTGTQRPFGVRSELAGALKLPEKQVHVIVPDTGSGYGGKHTGDAAVEAARLAKATGRPVKVVWTREEEFTWAYFRPAGVIEVKSGATRDGRLTAWECHNYNSGGSGLATPYDVPNQHVQFHFSESPLKQGSYRVLAATANHFARESHMDELAHALGLDPLVFRLKNLKHERLQVVFEAAAERFGWKAKPAPGHGFGIAGGVEKGGHVATCAEVAVDRARGQVRVVRLVTAFDCGAVVNPDGLTNQIEGAVVMGLGGALFEAIHFADGKILNPRLSRYRVPRFRDLPQLETVLLDRKDKPSAGAGECPLMAVAPAVGNAIFAACGVRLRAMPMVPEGLKVAAAAR